MGRKPMQSIMITNHILRISHGHWRRQVVGACFALLMATVTWFLFIGRENAHQGAGPKLLLFLTYLFEGEERALEGLDSKSVSLPWDLFGCVDVAWTILCLFFVVALILMITLETWIDPQTQCVQRRWSLMGCFTLYSRSFPLSDFAEVRVDLSQKAEFRDMWWVVLKRKSGSELSIQWFDEPEGKCPPQACECAQKISKVTGLHLAEIVVNSVGKVET